MDRLRTGERKKNARLKLRPPDKKSVDLLFSIAKNSKERPRVFHSSRVHHSGSPGESPPIQPDFLALAATIIQRSTNPPPQSGTLTVYFIRYSTHTSSTLQKPLDLTLSPNPDLHKSLYGLDYTPPFGGQYDQGCYITQQDVLNHVKLMSQLTTRIRLYGMDCLVADFTLNAVRLLNANLSVVLTLWEDNDVAMISRQRRELYRVVAKYGGANISYISVGNEVLLRAADKGPQAVAFLGKEIDKTRGWLRENGYGHISVVTTDVADSWSTYPTILSHSDEAWGNVHPFFAGVLPTAGWDFAIKSLNSPGTGLNWLANQTGKSAMISEIGWPTAPVNESYQASVPTVENMNAFLNLWVCPANRAGIRYFWFEAFDCPWKEAYSVREASWGLFDKDLRLKDGVTIPQCD
ncbi:glycoside hydrolase superfamily [Zopfochytrium polystomum]|nr:glycoside hydrolase superfamily [Zopfochytrium polystomum]